MWSWFKKFFMDETAFIRVARGTLMGIGGLAATGQLPDFVPDEVGAVAMGVALMFGAGDKNAAAPVEQTPVEVSSKN